MDFKLATLNNGFKSEFFTPKNGLFQGNPIASYLFILVMELLAIRLRQNSMIKGIKIGLEEILLSLFADDLALTMKYDQKSWEEVVREFNKFQTQTGMQINYNKSVVNRLGSIHHTNAKFYSQNKLIWTDSPINILGLMITADPDLVELNIEPLINKAEAILKMWRKRNLSLFGKVQVVNSLVASLFTYRLAVLPTPLRAFLKE